jgi:hypothetical protein
MPSQELVLYVFEVAENAVGRHQVTVLVIDLRIDDRGALSVIL